MTTTTQHPIDAALDRIHALGWHEREDLTAIMREVYEAGRASATQSATELVQWQQVARVWVGGAPVAQPRAKGRVMPLSGAARRFKPILSWPDFCRQVGKLATVQVYTPDPKDKETGVKKVSAWKQAIATASLGRKPAAPLDCPVRVDLTLYFPRPKSLMRRKDPDGPVLMDRIPDRDNCDKSVLDAMTDCGWWVNDGRVCAGEPLKLYHAKTGRPGALIVVSVPQDEQQDLFQLKD